MVVHYILQWNSEQYFNTTLIRHTFYLPRSTAEGRRPLDSWPQNSATALSILGARVPAFKGQRARVRGGCLPHLQGSQSPGAVGLYLSVSSASQILKKGC